MGIGIESMRERLRQFGGELAIRSWAGGTRLHAIVPFEAVHRNGSPAACTAHRERSSVFQQMGAGRPKWLPWSQYVLYVASTARGRGLRGSWKPVALRV